MGKLFIQLKAKTEVRTLILIFFISSFLFQDVYSQGFSILQNITPLTATEYTGDKPQSKVWNYGSYWWAVIPIPAGSGYTAGTYLFRLDGLSWTRLMKLDNLSNIKSDVKSVGGVTHILLKNAAESSKPQVQQAKLISIQFVAGSPPTYQLWTPRVTTVTINLPNYAETATIDIDSQNKMWIGTEGGGSSSKNIYVLWSASPYSSWSSPISLASNIDSDEICAITAFDGNKMGVLWSDQVNREFRFKFRNDSDSEITWQNVEVAASGTISGLGVADDHINFAVDSRDGTIYAAVKTSYANSATGEIRIGLLVRDSGTWTLYDVIQIPDAGTRPIVLLNENEDIVSVYYTDSNGTFDDIKFKESSIGIINFSEPDIKLSEGLFNNASSTKQSLGDDVVIVFANNVDPNSWQGVKAYKPAIVVDNGAGLAYYLEGINGQGISVNKSTVNGSILSDAVTLEAWFKTNTTADQEIINYVDPGASGDEGYALTLTASGKIRFQLNGELNGFPLDSPSDYPIGEWTHVAGTYDRFQTSVKLYINGEEVNSGTYSLVLGNGNSSDFVIGGADDGGSSYVRPFNGSLDELRLWNVARSENEIREYMCKKLDESSLPSSLIAYWRFDTPMGFTITDITGNLNDGTIENISGFQFEWSGAAIGDESIFDYTGSGGTFTAILDHPDGDSLTAFTTDGTGIQVYRVDASPLRQTISGVLPDASQPFENLSQLRFYGVKVIGTGSPTYTAEYDYTGHPGIENEATLRLAFRENLNDDSWEDAGVSPNVALHTLSKAGLTGTEFTLASNGGNPLPVELAYFTGKLVDNIIKLEWKTETEVSNFGFDIERSVDGIQFVKIGFVQGHGNSNSPKLYSYSDAAEGLLGEIHYRLKQIDTDGTYAFSNIISVDVSAPIAFELFQNYPNPFNPTTTIKFQIPERSVVTVKVFNSLGEEVAVLVNEEKEPGFYELNFNARNVASGVYIYTILANEFFATKKMILVK